jgi:hypothetical protein
VLTRAPRFVEPVAPLRAPRVDDELFGFVVARPVAAHVYVVPTAVLERTERVAEVGGLERSGILACVVAAR